MSKVFFWKVTAGWKQRTGGATSTQTGFNLLWWWRSWKSKQYWRLWPFLLNGLISNPTRCLGVHHFFTASGVGQERQRDSKLAKRYCSGSVTSIQLERVNMHFIMLSTCCVFYFQPGSALSVFLNFIFCLCVRNNTTMIFKPRALVWKCCVFESSFPAILKY